MISTDLETFCTTTIPNGSDMDSGLYRQVGKEWVISDESADDFPVLPDIPFKQVGLVITLDMISAIKRALAFASDDELTNAMNGVSFKIEGSTLRIAGTNGHLLSVNNR